MRNAVVIILVLVVGFGAVNLSVPTAQEKPNPCLDSEIRRAEAEVKVQTQATLIEAQNYHIDELNKRLRQLKETGKAERSEAVVIYDQGLKRQVAALEATGLDKDAQLADALRRIHRANRRKLCRILHIGCVPK